MSSPMSRRCSSPLPAIGRDEACGAASFFSVRKIIFSLMGVKPALGRFYNAAECRPNANIPVAVASYAFWKRLGGRADLIGKNVTINGQAYTLIGVTPEGFLRRERVDRARSLAAAGRLFAARLGLQRHRRLTRIWRAEKLHPQRHRPTAARPNDRGGETALARPRATTHRHSAARLRGRARAADRNAAAFQHQHPPEDDGPIGFAGTFSLRWPRPCSSSPA